MAKTVKFPNAQWIEVDPATFTGNAAKLYKAAREAYAASKAATEAFDAELRSTVFPLPEGRYLAIGRNFGKLSVANVPAEQAEPKTVSKKAQSAAVLAKVLAG